jgi:hypothetical protein
MSNSRSIGCSVILACPEAIFSGEDTRCEADLVVRESLRPDERVMTTTL